MLKALKNFPKTLVVPGIALFVGAVTDMAIKPVGLPPGMTFYDQSGLHGWGVLRLICFVWIALSLVILATITQRDAGERRNEALKKRGFVLASFYSTFGWWCFTFSGVLLLGGDWNVYSWIFGFACCFTAVRAVLISLLTASEILKLERRWRAMQDEYVLRE